MIHTRSETDDLGYQLSKSRRVTIDVTEEVFTACKQGYSEEVLMLLSTGSFRSSYVVDGSTALTWACKCCRKEAILALIATGNSDPEFVDCTGNTALTIICHGISDLTDDVILALLKTKKSNPGHVNNQGYTALKLLCNLSWRDERFDVVQALLATGESKPDEDAVFKACIFGNQRIVLMLLATNSIVFNVMFEPTMRYASMNQMSEAVSELVKLKKY